MARYFIPEKPYTYDDYMFWYRRTPQRKPPIHIWGFTRLSIEEQHRAILNELYRHRRWKRTLALKERTTIVDW